MNFKSLPWWGQIGLAAAGAGLLIFSQYKWAPAGLSAQKAQIVQLKDTLEKKDAEIAKGKQALAKQEQLARDIASLERKLADLRQILPTQPELGDLLKWIKALADQTNLELRVFGPGSAQEQEFLREQPIRMEVHGNYHQLGMFFDRVSKYARIINVENVKITPNSDRKVRATIVSSFVAKTYVYRDEVDDKGGKVEKSEKKRKKGGVA
jgi:type IV pilus assembly protein PilO